MAIKYLADGDSSNIEIRNKGMFIRHNQDQAARMVKGVMGEMYGLEMEVYSEKGQEPIINAANAGCRKWFVDMEPDGSLDHTRGLEIITRGPIPPSLIFTKGGWLARLLKRIVEEGGVIKGKQPQGYGLHINVNCAGWSWLEKNAFCAAINYMPNVNKQAAGRNSGGSSFNTYLDFKGGRPHSPQNRIANCYIRTNYGNPDCMEVRMFQMNTDIAVIRGYITHLREIRAFAQKFQPVLLMAASYFTGYHEAGITQNVVNAFLEKLWGVRDSTTLEQAQEEFDKSVYLVLVDRLVVPHFYAGSGVAKNLTKLYDNLLAKNKTFQQRYETLEALWATP